MTELSINFSRNAVILDGHINNFYVHFLIRLNKTADALLTWTVNRILVLEF